MQVRSSSSARRLPLYTHLWRRRIQVWWPILTSSPRNSGSGSHNEFATIHRKHPFRSCPGLESIREACQASPEFHRELQRNGYLENSRIEEGDRKILTTLVTAEYAFPQRICSKKYHIFLAILIVLC